VAVSTLAPSSRPRPGCGSGSGSRVRCSSARLDDVVSDLPAAELARIPGQGHLANVFLPAALTEICERFLAEVSASRTRVARRRLAWESVEMGSILGR
jgi:hypothetical protein